MMSLPVWLPGRRFLLGGVSVQGLFVQGTSVWGLFLAHLCLGESLSGGFSVRVKSGRYGPYWNAFLFDTIYSNCANQNHRILRNMESQQQVLSVVQKLTLRARE